RLGPADFRSCQTRAALDFDDYGVFHQAALRLDQLAVALMGAPGAKHFEELIGVREIGFGFIDVAAQGLENLTLPIDNLADARVERDSAEVACPSDANILEISIQRARETDA